MNFRRVTLLPTVAAVLAGGTSLMAQVTTGSLNGLLTDTDGKPIAGAKVVLESPALFATRTYVTDANGEYRSLLLPVGNYTVRVSAPGKLSKTATGVRVGVGTNLTLSFTLKPIASAAAATVEVVGGMAQESKTDDKVSVNYSAEQLLQLPSGGGPSFQGALGVAPGVTGSYSDTQTKIRGGDMNQVMYRIDGINVKDDSGKAGALYQPLPDSIEDIQVILSALNARYGSVSGGQVNVVTKSGSNEFSGTIRKALSRPSWASDYPGTSTSYNATSRSETWQQKTDITVSGPIIKDRLWFYAGTRLQPSQEKVSQIGYSCTGIMLDDTGNPNGATMPWDQVKTHIIPQNTYGLIPDVDAIVANGPAGYKVNLMDSGTWSHASIDYKKYEGKLTFALNENNMLSGTYLFEKTEEGNCMGERQTGNIHNVTNKNQVGVITTKTTGYTLNWNATLASNWTLEARVSHALRSMNDVARPAGYTDGPSLWLTYQVDDRHILLHGENGYNPNGDVYYFGDVGDPYRMSSYDNDEKRGNNNYSVNVTTFQQWLGTHQIDFGAERQQTIFDFGRDRSGHRAVWNGGAYMNAAGDLLYPVFHRTQNPDGTFPTIRSTSGHAPGTVADPNSAGWNGATWQLSGDKYTLWWWSATGPGATLERNWCYSEDEKNYTDSMYVNDSWTINSQWNLMVGARFNKLHMTNQGKDALDLNVFEPRAMIKFNPDGQNKRIFSFSIAKLSQAYSDQIANYFRGNEWAVNTMRTWNGANLDGGAQPGIDSQAAQNDTVSGMHNGYNYNSGVNMHGVRFVDYAAISDEANYYSGPGGGSYTDSTQTAVFKDMKAPYAIEMNLGAQRNFDKGWVKVNLVQRKYHDQIQGFWWAGIYDYGVGNWKLTHSPNPAETNTVKMLQWNAYYPNSAKIQTYRDIEFSFERQLSDRLAMSGSFTYDRTTGQNGYDYYTNLTLRNALIPEDKQGNITPDFIQSNDKFGYLALTWVQPVGKGNVSLAVKFNYSNNNGYTTPTSQLNYMDLPNFAAYSQRIPTYVDTNGNAVAAGTPGAFTWDASKSFGANGIYRKQLYYNTYIGSGGQYRNAWDTYSADAKLNADVPLYGKLHLIGYVELLNLFNSMQDTNYYTAFSDSNNQGGQGGGGGDARVTGRQYVRFDQSHIIGAPANIKFAGQGYLDYNYGNGGRRITNVSIGLKF